MIGGIALFITEGMRLSSYSDFNEQFVLTLDARDEFELNKENYKKSHTFGIVLGVSVSFLSILPIFLSLAMSSGIHRVLPLGLGLGAMLLGAGCFILVYTGNLWSAYKKLLQNGKTFEEMYEHHNKKLRKKIED